MGEKEGKGIGRERKEDEEGKEMVERIHGLEGACEGCGLSGRAAT